MSDEQKINQSVIHVVTRDTFDNRRNTDTLDDIVYFVAEPTSNSGSLLSLYVGDRRQTDIVNLNKLILDELQINEINKNPQTYFSTFNESDFPQNMISIPDKLYVWENTDLDTVSLFVCRKDITGKKILPIVTSPIWESL